MSKSEGPMGGFEERLLGELKQVVAARAAEEGATARPVAVAARAPRPRRRMWAGLTASVGAAAAGAAALVALPAMGGSAAYAVETNDDGTVTATIKEFTDAEGLERQLEEHGVSAEVDYVEWGQECQPERGESATRDFLLKQGAPPPEADGPYTFTVRPADFKPGETLVLETTLEWQGDAITGMGWGFQLVTGPVAPCNPTAIPDED
ncbi:hypothetical protein DMB38_15810 [Streptomyces sp. WAC 06738]|uniref:hypothetical protein n=1 Tax=Streptomyces sp. WAC 06738 TaxID=2203210 RepID=UPI000F6EBAB7|nr:hypothetical protein [Streptomyces sp. WAC 06738]AZM47076.1 hypothetical protein DMB38_15810 [Streptomyces sp. WAC 06738]